MSDGFVYRDGSRLTPYMYYLIERLNADINSIFGVEIKVSSGIRLAQEQIDIFLERYVTIGRVNGRYVYDTRVWNGTRYYRISSAGTVATPGTSNHEIQGNRAAVDLRDTGSDSGIMNPNSARGRWIRQNAWKYELVASGDSFGEGWHFDVRNIYNAVPAGGLPNTKPAEPEIEEEPMTYKSGFALRNSSGTTIVVVCDMVSGEEREFEGTNNPEGDAYNRNVAISWGCSPIVPVSYISASHFQKIRDENAATRARLDARAKLAGQSQN